MKTIHKYVLAHCNNEISAPSGAIPLTVQYQENALCVWMEVQESNPLVRRRILVVGTGFQIDEEMRYIGTVQEPPFVWHVYDGGELYVDTR